jgi:hypothetical protein
MFITYESSLIVPSSGAVIIHSYKSEIETHKQNG